MSRNEEVFTAEERHALAAKTVNRLPSGSKATLG
jgi:hypothetical protein